MLEVVLMLIAAYCALNYAGIMGACLVLYIYFVVLCCGIGNPGARHWLGLVILLVLLSSPHQTEWTNPQN